MGTTFGRILGRSSTAASGSATGRVANVKRANEPPSNVPETPAVDPSLHQPDRDLLNKLKDVYVESTTNIVTQENPFGSERITSSKLPQDRTAYEEDDKFQTRDTPEGYLTAQQVLDIFDKRAASESDWTVQKIATDYKISQEDAANLVKYFGSYRVMGKIGRGDPEMKLHPLHR